VPIQGFHSCRLRDPGSCVPGSYSQAKGTIGDKPIMRVICEDKTGASPQKRAAGSRIPADKVRTQAIRYPTDSWSKEQAKKHCESVDGTFEEAAKAE